MGQLIRGDAGVEDIIRMVRVTLARAEHMGAPFDADAEHYLRDVLNAANDLVSLLITRNAALDDLRAERDVGVLDANENVIVLREKIYNLIGRKNHDRLYRLIFPRGADPFTRCSFHHRPGLLLTLAHQLETVVHPRIPDEVVKEACAMLRATAAQLERLNRRVDTAALEVRFASAQYQSNARLAHAELAGLKRHWLGEHYTEQEIHRVIPPRGASGLVNGSATEETLTEDLPRSEQTETPTPEPVPSANATDPETDRSGAAQG